MSSGQPNAVSSGDTQMLSRRFVQHRTYPLTLVPGFNEEHRDRTADTVFAGGPIQLSADKPNYPVPCCGNQVMSIRFHFVNRQVAGKELLSHRPLRSQCCLPVTCPPKTGPQIMRVLAG